MADASTRDMNCWVPFLSMVQQFGPRVKSRNFLLLPPPLPPTAPSPSSSPPPRRPPRPMTRRTPPPAPMIWSPPRPLSWLSLPLACPSFPAKNNACPPLSGAPSGAPFSCHFTVNKNQHLVKSHPYFPAFVNFP